MTQFFGEFAVAALILYVSALVAVMAHEAGHWIVAQLCGLHVTPPTVDFHYGLPVGGHVRITGRLTRAQLLAVCAAGVSANLILMMTSLVLMLMRICPWITSGILIVNLILVLVTLTDKRPMSDRSRFMAILRYQRPLHLRRAYGWQRRRRWK